MDVRSREDGLGVVHGSEAGAYGEIIDNLDALLESMIARHKAHGSRAAWDDDSQRFTLPKDVQIVAEKLANLRAGFAMNGGE